MMSDYFVVCFTLFIHHTIYYIMTNIVTKYYNDKLHDSH
jgi:hypothetical protein